ncbi:MAG TPA: alpha/beta hydrolase [Rhizomicrobium sp.]|jgi:lysophospholipase|nr:alpha/beta hydrolase [Rhizomicrobium sp.]
MQPAADIFDPVPIQAIGARLRAARFAADPAVQDRGVCVLLNGQTEFIEKYFEVIDELRGRGFAVATMDWRGQGGSSHALTDNPLKSYVKDFAEYDEDLQTLMDWLVVPMVEKAGRPPIAVAHSMGAHNLLRYLVRKPASFRAVVVSAPMIAVSLRGTAEWIARIVTVASIRAGRGTNWVWGMERRDPYRMTFEKQLVTSDRGRFERTQKFLRENPDLRLAGATWGWLAAAFRSMDWLSAPGRPESITTPALVIDAGADRIVIPEASRKFAARMPHASHLEIAGAGHEILMERDVFRVQWWAAFDAFATCRTPGDPKIAGCSEV